MSTDAVFADYGRVFPWLSRSILDNTVSAFWNCCWSRAAHRARGQNMQLCLLVTATARHPVFVRHTSLSLGFRSRVAFAVVAKNKP